MRNRLIRGMAVAILLLANLMALAASQQLMPLAGAGLGGGLQLAVFFAIVMIHEAGHAAASIAFGEKVRVFAVWGIGYDFSTRRFGFQTYRGINRDVAGFVIHSLRCGFYSRAHGMIAISGPLANFLTATAAFVLGVLAQGAGLHCVCAIFGVLSIGMGMANLLPYSGSDGFIAWNALVKTKSGSARG